MGIWGLKAHNDSIAAGQWEWGNVMSITHFIAAG